MPRIIQNKSHRRCNGAPCITLFTMYLARREAHCLRIRANPKTHPATQYRPGCNQYSHGDASMQFRTCSLEDRWIAWIALKESGWLHELSVSLFLSLSLRFHRCAFPSFFHPLGFPPKREREEFLRRKRFSIRAKAAVSRSRRCVCTSAPARRITAERNSQLPRRVRDIRFEYAASRRAVTSQSELQTKRVTCFPGRTRGIFPETVAHFVFIALDTNFKIQPLEFLALVRFIMYYYNYARNTISYLCSHWINQVRNHCNKYCGNETSIKLQNEYFPHKHARIKQGVCSILFITSRIRDARRCKCNVIKVAATAKRRVGLTFNYR